MRHRILHVVDGSSAYDSLVKARAVAEWTNKEFDSTLLRINRGSKPLASNEIECELRRFQFASWYRIIRFLRNTNPHIIHFWHTANSNLQRCAKIARVPVIVETESSDIQTDGSPFVFAKDKGRCLVHDPEPFAWLHPKAASYKGPNSSEMKVELANRLGLPTDAILIAADARNMSLKKLKNLIWSIELLSNIDRRTHLLVFGEAADVWRAKRFRDQCLLNRNVKFLNASDRPDRWFAAIDIMWITNPCTWVSAALRLGTIAVLSEDASSKTKACFERFQLPWPNDASIRTANVEDRSDFARKTLDVIHNYGKNQNAKVTWKGEPLGQMETYYLDLYREAATNSNSQSLDQAG